MKKIMCAMVFIVMSITMNSCSADSAEGNETGNTPAVQQVITSYNYNTSELETMQLINDYRVSIGLNALEKINHISFKCEEHNKYMIENNVLNHNDFTSRSNNIMSALNAKKVGENVAKGYKTSAAALKAWLDSPGHKENIEGNYTHFGIAVTTDPTGQKYYTNIFVKI